MDRQGLIRKLQAIRAKALDGSTGEAEAIVFMNKFNALVAEYNVSDSELNIKQYGVGAISVKTGNKQVHDVKGCADGIAILTDTMLLQDGVNLVYFGTPLDRMYAVFLTELIMAAMDRETENFVKTLAYKIAVKTRHGKAVRTEFRRFMAGRLRERMIALHNENKAPRGNGFDLIVTKNALIEAFLKDEGEAAPEYGQAKVETDDLTADRAKRAADAVNFNRAVDTHKPSALLS